MNDGVANQSPTYLAGERAEGSRRKGKSARCIFCCHVHSLESVKAEGAASEYHDGRSLLPIPGAMC